MIALITSTLFPPQGNSPNTNYRNKLSSDQRIEQTFLTIDSLKKVGINEIYLFDNSGVNYISKIQTLFSDVNYITINSIQFENKGLSEIFLIKQGLDYIPAEKPILKISGRYRISKLELKEIEKDFYCKKDGEENISTRSYIVRNREVYDQFVTKVIGYMLNYNSRIRGPRSFMRIIKNSLPHSNISHLYHVELMLENAAWQVLSKTFSFELLNNLNIEGTICNNDGLKIISE